MLDTVLATILQPIPLESKINLPAPKAQQKNQLLVAIRILPFLRLLLHFFFPTKDFFMKFIKTFVESIQAWDWEQIEH